MCGRPTTWPALRPELCCSSIAAELKARLPQSRNHRAISKCILQPHVLSSPIAIMLAQIFAPLYLPVLHLVTLATAPATALYAIMGLLASPITVPLLIVHKAIGFLLFSPLLLLTLPVAAPVGALAAFCCVSHTVMCSFFVVLTPLLWPLAFLCKWWKYTCAVSQVVVMDTIMPWLVPIRFTFLAALLPKMFMK